jgi:uncharacterized membrane protein YdjX (TVP38/TMEM64 family)
LGTARRRVPRIALALAALLALLLYRQLDLGRWLSLEQLQASREALAAWYADHPATALGAFFAAYVALAALAIPGAVVLTLAGGAMFGVGVGVVIVSFASSLGALLACLAARYLLRDLVKARFGRLLATVDEGIARDGTAYLLTLRLVPVVPFFLVNLLMGLTPIGALRFLVVSQIGMLPATFVYVNAGTQLAALRSPADVLSPTLLASFALIGVLPLVAKAAVARWARGRR